MLSKIIISIIVIAFIVRFKSVRFCEYKKLKFHFKMSLYCLLLTLSTTILLPILVLRPKQLSNGVLLSSVLKQIMILYRIEWHIRNEEILAVDRGAVIICNHQSVFDIAGLNHVWHVAQKMIVIVKKEILYTGPFGLATYLCGSIFIDRKNSKESYKKLEKTTQVIQNKTKIWIYPEGTRNTKYDGKLLPFKKGAFNIAVTAQVPILPVVCSPYYFIDRNKYIFNKGHVIMQCLEPVSTTGLTMDDVPALADQLHLTMSRAFKQLSEEVIQNSKQE